MKLLLTRSSKLMGEILLILLLLLVIVVGITRLVFPHLDRYKPYFEQWASAAIHQPVKIGSVQAAWKGLYPLVSLEEVTVLNTSSGQPLLRIQCLQVGANLWRSAWQRTFVPSSITLLGTQLQVQQMSDHSLVVNGIPLRMTAQTSFNPSIENVIDWLLSQGQLRLKQVALNWQAPGRPLIRISELTAVLSNNTLSHQLKGAAILKAKTPTRFRFVVNLSQALNNHQVRAECYVLVKDLDLSAWPDQASLHHVRLKQGNLQRLQLWAVWENQQWQRVQAVLKLKQAVITAPAIKKSVQFNQLNANIAWQRHATGFSLAADHIQLAIAQQPWSLSQFSVQQFQAENQPLQQTIQADRLELAQLFKLANNFTSIPFSIKKAFAGDQPAGILQRVLVQREIEKNLFSVTTDFSQLKIPAWHSLPAVNGLQGTIHLTPDSAEVRLDGNSLEVNAPAWFNHPFTLKRYHGDIHWRQDEEGWHIQAHDVALADAHLAVRGNLQLQLPSARNMPYVHLLAAFSQQDASHIRDYVPMGLLHTYPDLAYWLNNAFVAGAGADGQVLLHGPLAHFPFDDHTGRFEARVHTHDLEFNYAADWPRVLHLDAEAVFAGRSLAIQSSYAQIMHTVVDSAHAHITNLAYPELMVQGKLNTDMREGLRFIQQSPLQSSLGESLGNLSLTGAMQLLLGLDLPLYKDSPPFKVQGDVLVQPGGKLAMDAWGVHLTDLIGTLAFTENSLSSPQLTAQWLGQPAYIHIDTELKSAGERITNLHIAGHGSVANLQQAYGLASWKDKVQGEVDYSGLLQIASKNQHTQSVFSLASDLQGVSIHLPPPLAKSAAEKQPVHLAVSMGEGSLNIVARYAKKLSAALALTQHQAKRWQLAKGNVHFGSELAVMPTLPGLLIDGRLAKLNWSEMDPAIDSFFAAKTAPKTDSSAWLREIDLDIDQLQAGGMQLAAANIWVQPKPGFWSIEIDSPTVAGKLTLPSDLAYIAGKFTRFQLTTDNTHSVSHINPGDIPSLDLSFQQLTYATKRFANVVLRTEAGKNSLAIRRLQLEAEGDKLTASGRWQQRDEQQQHTSLSGNMVSTNLGMALKNWQITDDLVGGSGTAAFALSWPAAPNEISIQQLDGSVSFAFTKGSIKHIADAQQAEMSIGKLLNLLSLQSIPRRLALDFSDLWQQGFAFDRAQGDFLLQKGNAITNNAYVRGPIARIDMNGRIGFGDKEYDLTLITTPYITASVPVAATLVGGPLVGAAAWLGNKMLGNTVNKMAMSTHRLSGPWNNSVISALPNPQSVPARH